MKKNRRMSKSNLNKPMRSMNIAMKNIKLLSLSMFLVCMNIVLAHSLYAQDRNEEVTIIAPYKPTISDANKMNFQPSIKKAIQFIGFFVIRVW